MVEIRLPHQDHYEVAREAFVRGLRERLSSGRLERLGAAMGAEGALELPALCWWFRIIPEPFSMVLLPAGEEVKIVWQILALDYLSAEPPGPPSRFLSLADFAQTRGYLSAFEGRVSARLARGVGRDREEFARAAQRCGGIPGGREPLSYMFRFFPRFELQVLRHEGDEDFEASCSVLFPDNSLHVLSAESMIVAAETLVSSLHGKTSRAG